jgi:hypothetical protein
LDDRGLAFYSGRLATDAVACLKIRIVVTSTLCAWVQKGGIHSFVDVLAWELTESENESTGKKDKSGKQAIKA